MASFSGFPLKNILPLQRTISISSGGIKYYVLGVDYAADE